MTAGQKRADATVEVAAEAKKENATETEIMRETGRGGIALVHAPETAIGTETETKGRGEKNLPDGASAHPAPGKTKTETLTAGRTNTWTVLHRRSRLLVTSIMAKLPVSCSLVALFSWKG